MPRQTKPPIFTRRGQVLYHIFRDRTTDSNGDHVEIDPYKFIDKFICGAPSTHFHEPCLYCGQNRKLIAAAFCMGCTRGAIHNP